MRTDVRDYHEGLVGSQAGTLSSLSKLQKASNHEHTSALRVPSQWTKIGARVAVPVQAYRSEVGVEKLQCLQIYCASCARQSYTGYVEKQALKLSMWSLRE